MKFAICNETFVDWPLEKGFAFARECGYTGIEIAPFTIHPDARQISAARRAEVRRQVEDAGLSMIGLHWLLAKTEGFYVTSPETGVRRATSEYVAELARLCRDLGGSLMVFGSPMQRNLLPGVSDEQGMQYAADVFRAAMPVLEDLDVTLAIEPLAPAEGNFLLTAAGGVRLVEMIGSPQCRLHLDCKAMSSESTPIPEIIRRCAPWLVHFHANDPNRQGPGMGELDFVPILTALGEIDYRGWVSVEVFDYTPGPERLARESIDYLRRCAERVVGSDRM
ncbi:MAG TPA: sugar phosphate isomerase/epimerase family protein [Pirellulales bacterium]